jgi:hypothetical protein
MARSFKKVCAGGITTAETEKDWKRQEHQRYRSRIKTVIKSSSMDEDFDITISEKEFGDPWLGPKDGKRLYNKHNTMSEYDVKRLRMK